MNPTGAGLGWPEIAGLIVLAGFMITCIVTVTKFTDRLTKAEGALEVAEEARTKAERAIGDLAKFESHVAREYVTGSVIQRVEERLVQAIDRLGDRLDRAFERPKPNG